MQTSGNSLEAFLQKSPIIGDIRLSTLITELAGDAQIIFYGCQIANRILDYISPSCESILGYPPDLFIKNGPKLLYDICDNELLPEIIDRQKSYTRQAKTKGFDPRSILVHEFPMRFKCANGDLVAMKALGVVLLYTPTMDLEYGLVCLIPLHEPYLERTEVILKEIKQRHNEVYVHPIRMDDDYPLTLVHITNERQDLKISPREAMVLSQIANGNTTRQISNQLNISVNTVETHRKHLLQKFEAKNTAELVKKASKVFWLE